MFQIPPILAFGALSCAALAAAVLSSVALYLARRQHRAARKRMEADWLQREARWEAALEALSQRVEVLATDMRDFEEQIPKARGSVFGSVSPKTALNLTKRAQALRMHRRGDSPEQIATVLEVPLQEVELLLKVHRIVLSNI